MDYSFRNEPVKYRQYRELQYGDVIAVSRKLPYQHFGIYVGNDRVIHFASKPGAVDDAPIVHEAPFQEFMKDSKTFEILIFDTIRKEPRRFPGAIVNSTSFSASPTVHGISYISLGALSEETKNLNYHLYTPKETVERAQMVVKQFAQEQFHEDIYPYNEEYDLIRNNCEHFAIWCKTGIHESRQVEKVLALIRRIIK